MAECSNEFQAERLRMLPKKIKILISKIQEVKCEDVLSYMYRKVGQLASSVKRILPRLSGLTVAFCGLTWLAEPLAQLLVQYGSL